MLSEITRKEIEKKFGQEVRYPTDCEALAGHISMETKQRVSTSTLKRILGFVKGTKEPRLFTLDVIAQYLGCKNWDEYLERFARIENSEFLNLEQINIDKLKIDCRIEFTYEPDRRVEMLYCGDYEFIVVDSENSKLIQGDKLKILNIIKQYPMIISSVERGGIDIGQFKAGKISGITNINIIES
ncbi:MAG: hypothetical protein KKD31_07665 [Bacteroidetes bacterium]|nr:hypothetical protein [Bacteroidota bacterium]